MITELGLLALMSLKYIVTALFGAILGIVFTKWFIERKYKIKVTFIGNFEGDKVEIKTSKVEEVEK
jgi:hypothetical protein